MVSLRRTSADRRWNLLVNGLAASAYLPEEHRRWLYLRAGIDLAGTSVRPGCWFYSARVTFGGGGMINRGCVVENREPVTVGGRCFLGPGVSLLTSNHEVGTTHQRAGEYRGAPVVIGDGCWLGAGSVVLPGVTVAPGCVIAAGAVVTTDTDPDGLYAGVPARRRKDL